METLKISMKTELVFKNVNESFMEYQNSEKSGNENL